MWAISKPEDTFEEDAKAILKRTKVMANTDVPFHIIYKLLYSRFGIISEYFPDRALKLRWVKSPQFKETQKLLERNLVECFTEPRR